MKSYPKFKKKVLKNPLLRREYGELGPEFAIAQAIIAKRLEKGITQSELAQMIGTKQSAISRLESGSYNSSMAFLQKVADALGLNLVISLQA